MNKPKGCAFGLVLKERVTNMEKDITEGFLRIESDIKEMKKVNQEMFNHLSERPTKANARTISILTGIICALIGVVGTVLLT